MKTEVRSLPKPQWSNPVHLLAFGLGTGAAPVAPGTAGTLLGIPIFLVLQPFGLSTYLLVTATLFLAGIYLCGRTARELDTRDHPGIVWDEVVGYLVAMAGAPAGWSWLVAGFLLFRFFDIVKPWPIGIIDRRVHGGLGIMLDDLLAGIMASAVLQLFLWL